MPKIKKKKNTMDKVNKENKKMNVNPSYSQMEWELIGCVGL